MRAYPVDGDGQPLPHISTIQCEPGWETLNFKVGNPQDLDKLEAIHKKLAKLKRKEIRLKNKIARHMPECHGVMVGDTFQPVHPVYIGLGDNLEISQRHKPGHMEEVDRFPVYGRFTEEEPKPTIWDRLFGWIWW